MSVAKIYARALYQGVTDKALAQRLSTDWGSADTNTAIDQVTQQLTGLASLLHVNEHVRVALCSPTTSSTEKINVLEQLGKSQHWSPGLMRFLGLLAKKGRLVFLKSIVESFEEVRLQSRGGVLGKIETPEHLDKKDLQDLVQFFSQKLKKPVEFRIFENPDLLAGVRVTVEGVTYDGTLRYQLEELRQRFVEGVSAIQ